MQITIIKKNKLHTINLPLNVSGTHWITDYDNGRKLNLLSVEAEEGKWKLISNDDTYVVGKDNLMIPYVELKINSLYLIRNNIKGENYYIYCSQIYDETFKELGIAGEVTVGSDKSNTICFNLSGIPNNAFILQKNDFKYVLKVSDKSASVFVNKKRVMSSKIIEYGDIIFMFGLKIILMRKNGVDYLLVNNPNEQLEYNANMVNIVPVENTFIEDHAELSDEQMINEINYFYRTPLFYALLEKYDLKIDTPPQKKEEDKSPAILTIGPMLTMSMTSVVMLISNISSVANGERAASSAVTSVIMSVAMLASALLWPTLTRAYQKRSDAKYEAKRQSRYKKYLEKKEIEIEEALQNQRNILINNNFSVTRCQDIILKKDVHLWQKRLKDSDFLTLPVGIGNLPMLIDINYPEEHFTLAEDNLLDLVYELGRKERILNDVPITFSFYKNIATGIVGDSIVNKAFVDRLILQLVTNYSYDEVKIVTFTSYDNESDWEYLKTLPHSWSNDKTFRYFGSANDDYREIVYNLEKVYNERKNANKEIKHEPHYVIVTDSIKSIDSYDFIKNIMQNENNNGFSIIMLVDKLSSLPNECKNFIEVNNEECKIFSSLDNNEKQTFKIDTGSIDNLYECCKVLSNIPLIVKSNNETTLPDVMHFLEMYQTGKIEQLNSLERWKKSNPILSLQAPIGVGKSGELITLDLHEKYHGPHGLVAGTTGSGKSEFIITYILSLAVNYHPNEVQVILIDYKGGSLAGAFQNDHYSLPHLAGTITNLDGNELNRSLASIESEVKRRQQRFNDARNLTGESTMDIYKYQKLWRQGRLKDMEPIAHLFIVSDEFAELKEQQPEFMDKLISVARVGRSLGVHLILATQKPGGVVDQQIWSNTKFRVCLKVQDTGDSQEVIKKPDAAYLKKTGRFFLQVGTDEIFTLGQSAWAGGQYYPNTTFKKDHDVSINLINNIGFITSTKELENTEKQQSMGEELPNIVKYLANIAKEANIKIKKLWLDKIPEKIYVDNLIEKHNLPKKEYYLNPIIGEYDDPNTQNQYVLTVPFSKLGNAVVYGITGSGKEEFVHSLLYSCMQTYKPEEFNFYIMDFGSETLKVFEKSPYCGGVALLNDEDKIINLFKMIESEMDSRKKLFSDFGGSYESFIESSDKKLPTKLVIINNFEALAENHEDLAEKLVQITRDAYKYGIYFLVIANSPSSIRSKLRNNFAIVYALQQNDESDFSDILGNCRGKAPAKNKGRGLFKKDSIFEFQTAIIKEENEMKFLNEYCKNQKSEYKVDKIPEMPSEINYNYIINQLTNPEELAIGVNKETLKLEKYNMTKNVINMFSGMYLESLYKLAKTIMKQFNHFKDKYYLYFVDTTESEFSTVGQVYTSKFNEIITGIKDYIEKAYTVYEENNFNDKVLKDYKKIALVIYGASEFFSKLKDEDKKAFNDLVTKAQNLNILSIVLFEEADAMKQYQYEDWMKTGFDSYKGVWVGSGYTDQSIIKLNKIEREDREEIPNELGYIVQKGRGKRIKFVDSFEEK